ncbi:hypothetical protein C8J56DRAFT_887993 [Mycena floridula]|nr:hypothetical protein C8J56DRAFT_887993 [Mycena floridula]
MRSTSLFIGLGVLGAASSLAAPAPVTVGAITARDYNDFQLEARKFLELDARKDTKDTKDTKGGRDTSGGGRRPRRSIELEVHKDTKDTKAGWDTSGGGRRPPSRRSIDLEYMKLFTLYGIPFDLCISARGGRDTSGGGGKHTRDVELGARKDPRDPKDTKAGRDTSGGGRRPRRSIDIDARGGRDTSGGGGKHTRDVELEYVKLFTLYGLPLTFVSVLAVVVIFRVAAENTRDIELDARGGRDTGNGRKH